MAYSRWGGSRWYTFWAGDPAQQTRDTAEFEICTVATVAAAEIRADVDACVERVSHAALKTREGWPPSWERQELRGYMLEFLADVERHYTEQVT